MRSATGTKSGLPAVVVRATKSRMALFGAVSFHDGSGSTCARTTAVLTTQLVIAANASRHDRLRIAIPRNQPGNSSADDAPVTLIVAPKDDLQFLWLEMRDRRPRDQHVVLQRAQWHQC